MEDIKKMLSAFINSQGTFNQRIEKDLKEVKAYLSKKIEENEKNVTSRIDTLGRQLAYLEDDAPTREEFDILNTRVDKIEHKSTII